MAQSVGLALLLTVAISTTASAQDTGTDVPQPAATVTPQPLTEANYFKTIKVIQKRPVTKARRLELCPFFSYLPNDDFVRGYVPGVHVAYHMNEGVALEGTAAYGLHSNKQLLKQIRQNGVEPAVLDRMQFLASGGLNWAPIYGKLAYLERRILTYDLFLTTGFGVTSTDLEITTSTGGGGGGGSVATEHRKASFQGYYIGIGQRYYFTDWAALRIELRNYAYTQRVDANFNDRNNLLLGVGFSFLL